MCGAIAPLLAILASGHVLASFDSARLFAPMRALVAGALRAGRLPLWNPYEATGMPLFAQGLHGVLHPWSLLAAAVASGDGVDLMIVLHVASGALGAAVLARTLGASRGAAAVAGIGYGLSGYLLSMSRVLTFLAAGGTAPWTVAGLIGAARPGRWRAPAAAAAVALLHLAGDPQWTLVAVVLGLLLAVAEGGWKAAARPVLSAAAGTLVAGIQLAPAWAYYARSARRVGLDDVDRLQWALAPWRLVELLAPGFFAGTPGRLEAPVFRWLGGASRYPIPFVHSVAVGAPVLFLAALGGRTGRTGRVLGAAALALLWLALGGALGASAATGWIPIWGSIRYAEKLVGPLTLCLAVLAALGADAVARGGGRAALRVAVASAAGTGAAAVAARLLATMAGPAGAPADAWRLACEHLATGLAHAALGLAVTSAVVFAARERALALPWVATALAVVVLVEGWAAAPFGLHPGRPALRDPLPLRPLREQAAVPRVMTPLERDVLWIPSGLDELDASLAVQSRMGAAPFTVPSGIDQINTYTGVEPGRVAGLFRALVALGPAQLVALRRFGVTHAVLPTGSGREDDVVRASATIGGRRVGLDRDAQLEVWALPHRPWASFAERVRPVAGEAQAATAVAELEAAGDPAVALVGVAPERLSPGVVLGVERSPESVWIVAEAPGDGLLVVNDAEWPGWEATVDGRTVAIQLADGLVRAVPWPAGRHVLQMTYRPLDLRIGIALSGAGLLLVLALALAPRRRA